MAHFAKLNNSNIVEQVLVVSNDVATSEQVGIDFLKSLYGNDTVWKQTSYNGNFRKNFAGIRMTYDEDRDAFIPKKPFNSWVLNETTCLWESPVAYPNDGQKYNWNETDQSWTLVTE
jgi:hypothetical protein